ncbi:MAG: (R)-citramalate synthase [Elusimicrobia bacterium]|nr:(R)-citramalate synthase [Elusimicrobiota bacterium]
MTKRANRRRPQTRSLPSSTSTVKLFDTTLRDGTQGEGISISVDDKLKVAEILDRLGIHYIEGGWPGSNPKDELFFSRAKKELKLKNAKLVAFSSTRRKGRTAASDDNIARLVSAHTPAVCVFGKSWDSHVVHALRASLPENLEIISDTVSFLKSKKKEVIYDAEHFFDGYRANPSYALQTLKAAIDAGADNVTLCDTNGGCLPEDIAQTVREVRRHFPKVSLGIHVHNDSHCAVANSLVAVQAGVDLVQGTLNGYGERCGNANLSSIIANLKLKMGIDCISDSQLLFLSEAARTVDELANVVPQDNMPYVGNSAFAHKGGVHASAVARSASYEHIDPAKVGNRRRILISELSGKANVLAKVAELKLNFDKDSDAVSKILQLVKQKEHKGYQYEGAEGSFVLLVEEALGKKPRFFQLDGFRVTVEKETHNGQMVAEATLKISVNGKAKHTVAEGTGPVDALDKALRRALEDFYPIVREMSLMDFKVRVINAQAGTSARVRVFINSKDSKSEWGTVGVSENVIEASWQALVDAVEYKLFKDRKRSSIDHAK